MTVGVAAGGEVGVGDLLGAHLVIHKVYFGNHHGRVAGQLGLNTDAQIHDALLSHSLLLSFI